MAREGKRRKGREEKERKGREGKRGREGRKEGRTEGGMRERGSNRSNMECIKGGISTLVLGRSVFNPCNASKTAHTLAGHLILHLRVATFEPELLKCTWLHLYSRIVDCRVGAAKVHGKEARKPAPVLRLLHWSGCGANPQEKPVFKHVRRARKRRGEGKGLKDTGATA